MIVNVYTLTRELEAAGIPIHGVSGSGRIDFKDEATVEQRDQAAVILANHDPAVPWQPDLDRENEVRVLERADAALQQIANDRTMLAADLAALPGATTAERWNIVGRMIDILNHSLNREETEVKVLVRLARRYLGEE